MDHQQISPPDFTPTIGAYSHGTCIDIGGVKLLFTTGQIAMDVNGDVVSDDVAGQTEYIFENLSQILAAEKMDFSNIIKVQIFVTDMADFSVISPIRNKYLNGSKPVSTLVEVSKLVKDGCKIEIEVMAVKKLQND